MEHLRETIDVDVPVSKAYGRWARIDEFANVMDGMERVDRIDSRRSRWIVRLTGVRTHWEAEIIADVPNEIMVWQSTSGPYSMGMVTFDRIGPSRTRLSLALEYEPANIVQLIGAKLGVVERRIRGDLQRFCSFVEAQDSVPDAGVGARQESPVSAARAPRPRGTAIREREGGRSWR